MKYIDSVNITHTNSNVIVDSLFFTRIKFSVLTFQGDGDLEREPLRIEGLYQLTKFYEMKGNVHV